MATILFKDTNYPLSRFVDDIERGEIGLPDIQRPFVWNAIKARDLFDSMYRGFPVGYLLFWESCVGPAAAGSGSTASNPCRAC